MKSILSFVSNTIKGGIFFLLPILLVLFIARKGIELIRPLAEVISNDIGIHSTTLNIPYILSIITVILICFGAGWISSLGVGKVIIHWIEENILSLFPGYLLMKNSMESKAGLKSEKEFPVVLVPIDGLMFGFLMDEFENGDCVVFVPSAPSAWEGNVIIFKKDQVTNTNYKQGDISTIMRKLGADTVGLLEKRKI